MGQEKSLYTRDFREVLEELRYGACTRDLSEALQEVTESVVEAGKKGVVTLKLEILPKGAQVLVRDSITTNAPKPDVQPTIMFVDADKNLTRRNPKQLRLDETAVKVEEKQGAIVIDPETGEITNKQKPSQ